eukprot:TRINITY_DN11102_c0_g1_i1.p1 TRINITY_DN11102_c0_g1~~TRINITY_DN11102_c0_g1_i1.p1  ORF type:complete len:317 (+),score=79.12 TRINITY_DN11102_c0_g1_i1:31-951(+)
MEGKKGVDMDLKGKTVLITGATRGIGKEIGLRFAREGANIVIAAKTENPDPRIPGTIYSAAEEIKKVAKGGDVLAVKCDIRNDQHIEEVVRQTVAKFGGIDIVVNNASAIWPKSVPETNMKRYDLMNQVNARGTYATTAACLPYLIKSAQQGRNPHVLVLSPPLNMEPKWFSGKVAYTIAKYGMSMCVLGMSAEFKEYGIAVNALWPRTVIATAAVKNLLGGDEMMNASRTPEIMSDAAFHIVTSDSTQCTGNFFVDDKVLFGVGYSEADLDKYAVVPGNKNLAPDFFIEETDGSGVGLKKGKAKL